VATALTLPQVKAALAVAALVVMVTTTPLRHPQAALVV
jgi:hypothetical protein